MKIKPLHDHVIVSRLESEEKTPGGIIIPDTANEKSMEGKVVAVAEGATEEVAAGDRVIFKEYGGTELSIDDQKYVLLESDDLLAKYVATDKIPK